MSERAGAGGAAGLCWRSARTGMGGGGGTSTMSTTSPRLNSPSWLRSYFSMMVAAIALAFALFPESYASASTAATKAARFDMALGGGLLERGRYQV